jgi:hypothetical protein
MGDLLGEDFDLVQKDNLYRCLDKRLTHKTDLFSFGLLCGAGGGALAYFSLTRAFGG